MASKDPELRRRHNRVTNRNRKFANWRQIYIDCSGMCVWCGEVEGLEYHHITPDIVVLLCHFCHDVEQDVDQASFFHYHRNMARSLLAEDIEYEIVKCGGYVNWLEKYNLKDTEGRLIHERHFCRRLFENSRGLGSFS